MEIPANTIFSLYGGLIMDKKQSEIFERKVTETAYQNGWNYNHPEREALWKNR